ncbi:DNA (cytosine-5-)-methyltransferase [Clostridium sporogenes]|uniref:DNA (cytosine-5-)-methyltransferase n=1 Tax=Clostridium botulinum TaxID=1491 RepID=UPI0007260BD7|nr:DNA (cytosine-5-)-methyltransferase [Clostridium botulinum]KRU29361.1 DNA (cytosine-5-)-methyltransferase [Clostridium sporogenes]KRU33449.1 DNA (cytosine-5-)-methyltransferase [Clostridium sporogenes]KRU33919.1 DNA (cytosine-5-)-methyltransferase [Clostridium sporogenes]KRU43433.1 DNA (cytosine-5-)-methyltransferase [Clostridium sporogenes]MCW6073468.1 DNA cytosine methyltransferase [Clostridium botulinum]
MKKIKLLSLFSGIGAFEKALSNINQDYEVINYCEIDRFASYAYSILHDIDENLNLGDVSTVDTNTLKDFDLLTYGFPCQDISLAGKMQGIVKGQTRSGLLYEALRIIKSKKPKFAIAENVRNLVSCKFIDDFNLMLNELDSMGYNSYWQILNSKDYGAPQSRERVFIVSIRKDIDTGLFKFPAPIDRLNPINNFLDISIDEKYYCNDKYINDFINSIDKKIVDNKNPNKYGLLRAGEIKKPTALDMNNRVFSTQGACPTILTSSDSIPKILEYKVRKLTPNECWKATGFTGNDYIKVKNALINKFYKGADKTDTQMYKMAGNSIVVQVLECLLKELLQKMRII